MPEALQVAHVTAGYARHLPILHAVDLVAQAGEVTAIIGPNGAGKSTLIKAISGVVPVASGRITLSGQDITGLRPDQIKSRGVAYVPQTDNVFRSLTVRQNLDLALTDRRGRDALLDRFAALRPMLRRKAGALSGGQRQMLAVAMALAGAPRLILMDEPSAGLSPKAAEEVLLLVRGLADQGVAIVLVEQNVGLALKLADRCYILAEGRNQLDGPAAELARDPAIAKIYLGAMGGPA